MQNIMSTVLQYREAARLLWNQFLREQDGMGAGPISDARVHDWLALKYYLFMTLVVRPTGNDARVEPCSMAMNEAIPFLRVVPRLVPSDGVPAMISRTAGRSGYWDHAVDRLEPDDDLRFIDFFDWGEAGYRDFQYFHVAVHSSPRHPELAGHEALVEVQYADVYVEDVQGEA